MKFIILKNKDGYIVANSERTELICPTGNLVFTSIKDLYDAFIDFNDVSYLNIKSNILISLFECEILKFDDYRTIKEELPHEFI